MHFNQANDLFGQAFHFEALDRSSFRAAAQNELQLI